MSKELVLDRLPQIPVTNWDQLRGENRRDFERNLVPLFKRLDLWRGLSARGKVLSSASKSS